MQQTITGATVPTQNEVAELFGKLISDLTEDARIDRLEVEDIADAIKDGSLFQRGWGSKAQAERGAAGAAANACAAEKSAAQLRAIFDALPVAR